MLSKLMLKSEELKVKFIFKYGLKYAHKHIKYQ